MSSNNGQSRLASRNGVTGQQPISAAFSLLPSAAGSTASLRALPQTPSTSPGITGGLMQASRVFQNFPGTGLSTPSSTGAASNPLPPPTSVLNGPSFANPAPNMDSSEFPALGGNTGASSASSATPGLLSTYASQAGTGLPPTLGLQTGQPPRDFSTEDFPALGPGPHDGSGHAHNSLHSLLNGATSRQQQALQQEQQSAAAALAHRQGLLGSLGGNAAAARNGTGSLAAVMDEQKRQNYALKLGAVANSMPPGNSPPGIPSASSAPLQPGQGQGIWPGTLNGPPLLSNGVSSAPGANVGRGSSPSNDSSAPSHQARPEMPQTAAEQIIVSPADRFGLLGLLHLIKHATPGQSLLSLGSDLSKLGLEMGRRDPLSSDFATPWSEPNEVVEPEFSLPACYNVQPPPASAKIINFTDETLFFIFYAQPRDYMQELAAAELYKHNWRYHKELKLWLTKEAGVEPTQKTSNYERGSYIFFDPLTWEKQKRPFTLVYADLESRTSTAMPPPAHAAQHSGTAAGLPLS